MLDLCCINRYFLDHSLRACSASVHQEQTSKLHVLFIGTFVPLTYMPGLGRLCVASVESNHMRNAWRRLKITLPCRKAK